MSNHDKISKKLLIKKRNTEGNLQKITLKKFKWLEKEDVLYRRSIRVENTKGRVCNINSRGLQTKPKEDIISKKMNCTN